MRRSLIESNRLKDEDKDNIKEHEVADIHRNKSVTLDVRVVNNETDNILKQSSKNWMTTPVTHNEWNKLKNSQPQIENPDCTENKIKIDEMKQNLIRELAKTTNTDMKNWAPLKIKTKMTKITWCW